MKYSSILKYFYIHKINNTIQSAELEFTNQYIAKYYLQINNNIYIVQMRTALGPHV